MPKASKIESVVVDALPEEPLIDGPMGEDDLGDDYPIIDGDEDGDEAGEYIEEMQRIPEGAEGSPEAGEGPGWEPKDVKAARLERERAAAAAKKQAEELAKTEKLASELALLEQQDMETVNNATSALTFSLFERAKTMDIPSLKQAYNAASKIEGAAWLSRSAVTYWLKLRVHQQVALTRRRAKDGEAPQGATDFEQAMQDICREVGTARATMFNDDGVYRAFFEQEVVTHDGVAYTREQSLRAVEVLVHQAYFKIAKRFKACPRKALAIMVDASLSDPGFGPRSAQLIVDNLNAGRDPRAVREEKEAEGEEGVATDDTKGAKKAKPASVNTGLLPVDVAALVSCLSQAGELANRSEATTATWYIVRGANNGWAVQSVPPSVPAGADDVIFLSVHREDTGKRIYANIGFDVSDDIKDNPEKCRDYLVG